MEKLLSDIYSFAGNLRAENSISANLEQIELLKSAIFALEMKLLGFGERPRFVSGDEFPRTIMAVAQRPWMTRRGRVRTLSDSFAIKGIIYSIEQPWIEVEIQ